MFPAVPVEVTWFSPLLYSGLGAMFVDVVTLLVYCSQTPL